MAEVAIIRNNALPYPLYFFQWTVIFPIFDNTGSLVSGAAGLDSEVSKNGDSFTDCTNEATEIGSSGMYYLTLTSSEMTADLVTVIVKTSTTDAKTTPIVLYPRKELNAVRSGTAQGGASNSIQLDSGAVALDDYYNGLVVRATIDGNEELRVISDYQGSNTTAFVTPNWNVAPDSDDTFQLLLPDGIQFQRSNTALWNSTVVATPATAGIPDVNAKNWNNLATVALPLIPTTAGRALDVSTGGEAGIDWANIGSPTTVQGLSGTTIKAVTDGVTLTAGAIQAVWDALTSALTTVGSIGKLLASIILTSGKVTVGTNDDKTGYAIGTGGISAASFAASAIDNAAIAPDAIGSSELASSAVNEIADGILTRNINGGSSTGRTVKEALKGLRNRVDGSTGTLTVYEEDDTTPSWTAVLTRDAAADPITEINPS